MRCLPSVLLASVLPAQELLWQVPAPPSSEQRFRMEPFGDYDGDGCTDFSELVLNVVNQPQWRMVSGRDGSVLWRWPAGLIVRVVNAGDVDGDGRPDFAVVDDVGAGIGNRVLRIVSYDRTRTIWQQIGLYSHDYGAEVLGDLDVDGDGRSEVVTLTRSSANSTVYVYDSSDPAIAQIPHILLECQSKYANARRSIQ